MATTANVTIQDNNSIYDPIFNEEGTFVTLNGVKFDRDNSPVFGGNLTVTGIPADGYSGKSIILRDSKSVIATVPVNSDGSWSYDLGANNKTLIDGSHNINVLYSSNGVMASKSYGLIIDTMAVKPTVYITPLETYLNSDGTVDVAYTSSATPTVCGIAEPNSVVEIYDLNNKLPSDPDVADMEEYRLIGTVLSDNSGYYTMEMDADQLLYPDGPFNLRVGSADVVGNTAYSDTSFIVDTATGVPTIMTLDSNGASFSDRAVTIDQVVYTNDPTPTITGYAESGATITIKDEAGLVIGSATVSPTAPLNTGGPGRKFTFTPEDGEPLSDGSHTLTFVAQDRAGNISTEVTSSFTIDSSTIAPTLRINEEINGDLQDLTPTLSGTAEPYAIVQFSNGTKSLGFTTADANGHYSHIVPSSSSLTNARGDITITASATDRFGNTRDVSGALAVATNGTFVVCYVSGTQIETDRGNVAVELLKVGDRVKTVSGDYQPVVWLGHNTINCRNQENKTHAYPVRIAQHAFGFNMPSRDLYVSPLHSLYVSGVMIPAIHLVNGISVTQDRKQKLVTYYHVELPQHNAIFAEGMPAESYLDTTPENRHFFKTQADNVVDMNKQFLPCPQGVPAWQHIWDTQGYAPLTQEGPILEAVKHSLMERVTLVEGRQRKAA